MAYIGNSPALDETVSSSQIVDLTIATADIAADAITGAKIADDAIDSEHYTNASIDAAHLASGLGGWVKLQSITASSDATVDMETGIGSTYDHYMIMVKSVVGVTDGQDLDIRLKVGGSYLAADYRYRVLTHSSAGSGFNDNVSDSDDKIRYVMAGLGSNASEGGDGVFWFNDPTNTSKFHMIHWSDVYSNPAIHSVIGAGGYTGGTGALTGVQFLMNSGNLESGIFTLYGLTK